MKVVLFCGGLGMRLREYSETIPKPMVPIGYRPILWHLMKYYAHFGHKEFILCLGYRADLIKQYFLNYDECLSNDFTMSEGGQNIEVRNPDIEDWRITFVDTGVRANIAGRLLAVREHVRDEEYFLANYADGLTDMTLNEHIEKFIASQKTACFLSVRPTVPWHLVTLRDDETVENLRELSRAGIWMNGGFFSTFVTAKNSFMSHSPG